MKTQHASDASKRDGNATEQYFATEPSSEDVRRRMKVTLRGQDAVVEVSNGVFSGSRLDLGTSVLLREVPEPPETGTLLDLGCGWGPVSLALAFASPKADVWAVDVNERALDLTRANAKSNGCEHIHAASPEQVPADLTFDPADPHRQGRAARPADDVAAAAQPRRRRVPGGAEKLGRRLADPLARHRAGRRL